MTPSITELVRSATVVIADGQGPVGSGFLVAPDRVLTCAHVLHGRVAVSVWWSGVERPAGVLSRVPETVGADNGYAFPDTAILEVTGFANHPVVPLGRDEPRLNDEMYVFGMTKVRTGKPERDGSMLRYSGRIGDGDEFFKLVGGQIAQGQSGGPVLNLRTNVVCGMTKQGLPVDRGGYAIPIAAALASWGGEDLWVANEACHREGMMALRRAQAGFGKLPTLVTDIIQQRQAGRMLAGRLADLGRTGSWRVADEDLDEWVARQLFTMRLKDLVALLDMSAVGLGAATLEILHYVSCCLPLDDKPTSYWVPSDAAATLRQEWNEVQPKVVRVATECWEIARSMALRAIYRKIKAGRVLPFSAETGPDGLPVDLVDDVFGELARYGVSSELWSAHRSEFFSMVGDNAPVFYLDGRALGDTAVLAPLLDRFGGLRFMIISRDVVGECHSEHMVDLRPAVNQLYEGIALGLLRQIEEKIDVRTSPGNGS